MSLKNGKSKHHKNIRQAYNELLDKHEQLVNAFMIMQRSMKLILLTQSKALKDAGLDDTAVLYYTRRIAERYLDHHLDEMTINIRENEELHRMELTLWQNPSNH